MSEVRQCNCQELSSEALAILLGIDADHIKLILGEATEEKKGEICQKWEDYHEHGIEMTKELDELFANLCQQHKGLCPQSGPEVLIKHEVAPVTPEVTIPYTPKLDIRNVEFLPRGTGARYLITIKGQGDELIAKRWARVIPTKPTAGEIIIDMTPTKVTPVTQEVTEREARYGFLQLNEAEYQEAIKSSKYPEPARYGELTAYYTEPHEPGWKGLSLAEMFPTKYKDLLKRGVPDRLSPFEVKTAIEEKRIPYGRGVELGISELTPKSISEVVSQKYLYRTQNIGTIDNLVKTGKLIGHTPQEAHDAILKAHPEYAKEWEEAGVKREEATWGIDEQETQEPRLYFTKKEETGYAGELLVRVKRDIADEYGGELIEDIGLPSEYFYNGRVDIPINQIEVKVGTQWKPLAEIKGLISKAAIPKKVLAEW